MANQDLFKQAIAEAKSVREAAIINAKEALEETLTPHLKELLAAKLQEMEDADNEDVVNEMDDEVEEMAAKKGNFNAQTDAPEDQLEEAEDEEAEDDSEKSEDEAPAEEDEEEIEVKDMEVEDLKNLIRDIVAQEMGAGEEDMPADDMDMDMDAEPQPDDTMGGDEEEINLEELLAELEQLAEGEESGPKAITISMDPDEEINSVKPASGGAKFSATPAKSNGAGSAPTPAKIVVADAEVAGKLMKMYKDKSFDGFSSTLNSYLKKNGTSLSKVLEVPSKNVNENSNRLAAEVSRMLLGNWAEDPTHVLEVIIELLETAGQTVPPGMFTSEIYSQVAKIVSTHSGDNLAIAGELIRLVQNPRMYTPDTGRSDLQEALKTVKILRNQLSEINLLNAKLLYLNKVLRTNNLTESQKVTVITSFDKAVTVSEVKLVYETVKGSFVNNKPKSTIKESKGFASAATGNSTKPTIINQVDEQVLRMQKLAGIIR